MEPEGARCIFNRSIETHGLQYNEFYGNGDSKSFSTVERTYESDRVSEKKSVLDMFRSA